MSLVHLHRHSEWSLGDGVGTSEMYAERSAQLGQTALAITDHGSLAGALYHMQACEKVGIKPILGMEAYFRQSTEKDMETKTAKAFHLVLLAQNDEGWKNLMRLSSESHMEGNFYHRPNIDWQLLNKYSAGLIATSSCVNGFIPQALLRQDTAAAESHIAEMQDMFGDRFYFEVQPHDFGDQAKANEQIAFYAKSRGIPMIATADVHVPYEDWVDTQHVRQLIAYSKTKKNESDESDEKEYGGIPTTYLMSEDELRQSFAKYHKFLSVDEIDSAIKATQEVADRCDHIVIDKSPKVPHATKSVLEAERVLREWCKEGLDRIGKGTDVEYIDRMNEELAMMKKLKVMDYFVIVGDMIRWAKDQGIRVGPGRGSAGGSLVCYLTRITALDPIGYGLLFERFLNEYRTEIPDVDVDFDPERRHEVKQYMVDKYGADYVIDVAAFQSFGLKAAVKDVARALSIPYLATTTATDSIPDKTFGETLESLEATLPVLAKYFEKYPEVRKHATRLQNQIKGTSRHAAAVIVTDRPAIEAIPMMRAKDGGIVTQWSERANAQLLSPYGFLKIDMLVTQALTAQAQTIALIKERHGVDIDFEDPVQFPVVESPFNSDPDVIKTFAHGRNLGIFQFASGSVQGLLKQIQPTNLDHVIAANALNRPGTLSNGVAFEYAKRKNGGNWKLPHKLTEPFLGSTYGLMIFQEQVMQMYRALAQDVDTSESAMFLKVVAKGIARDLKGKQRLQAYYDKFERGCMEKGIQKASIDEIWSQILEMTTYSFNRSHSAGYGLQAYQDAWLKSNYPLEFYNSLLSTEEKKIPQIIRESRAYGVNIKPPDINASGSQFTIDGNAIRFGLIAVKGVADAGLNSIMMHRPFTSLAEFESKVPARKCNSKARASLVACGAFDSIGERTDWNQADRRTGEKEALGFVLDRAEFDKEKDFIESRIDYAHDLAKIADKGESVIVGGEIVKSSEHTTKNGDPYCRVTLELDADVFELVFWKEEYSKYRHLLADGAAILVNGPYDAERGQVTAKHCITAAQLKAAEEKEKNDG